MLASYATFAASPPLLLMLVVSIATDGQVPTADEVIQRHIEAIGGQAAIDAVETMRYERVYVHLEEEMVIHRLIHKMRPGKSRNCSMDTGSCFVVDGARSWTKTVDPEDGEIGSETLEDVTLQFTEFTGGLTLFLGGPKDSPSGRRGRGPIEGRSRTPAGGTAALVAPPTLMASSWMTSL